MTEIERALQVLKKALDGGYTLCNVDKVLAQLEKEKEWSYDDFEDYAKNNWLDTDNDYHYLGLERAMEIIKENCVDMEGDIANDG